MYKDSEIPSILNEIMFCLDYSFFVSFRKPGIHVVFHRARCVHTSEGVGVGVCVKCGGGCTCVCKTALSQIEKASREIKFGEYQFIIYLG